jgi:hypothetical protein
VPKYTLNIPDDLLESLRDYHAQTFPEHRRPFGPWLVDVWATWLSRQRDKH